MFVLLFNVCGAIVSVQRQESAYSTRTIQKGGQSVTETTHHEADVTQVGPKVTAHEIDTELTHETTDGLVKKRTLLQHKVGKKVGVDAVTKMRKAMGFSVQPEESQAEQGRMILMEADNLTDSVAGVPFYPKNPPVVDTSRIFCDDGRCTRSMSDIVGNDVRG